MNLEFDPLVQLLANANADINFQEFVEPFLGNAMLLSGAFVNKVDIAAEAKKRAEQDLTLSKPDGKFSQEELWLQKAVQELVILRDNEELLKKGIENIKNCRRYVNVISGMESKKVEMEAIRLYRNDKEFGFDVVMPKSLNVMKDTEDMLIIKMDKSIAEEMGISINFEEQNAAKDKNQIDEAAGGVALMEKRQLKELAGNLMLETWQKENETFLKISLQNDLKVSAEEKKQNLQNEQIEQSPIVEYVTLRKAFFRFNVSENEQKSNEMQKKEKGKVENEQKLCMEKQKEKAGNEQKLYLDNQKAKEIAENEQKSNEMKQKQKAENEPKLCMEKQKEKAGNEQKLYMDKQKAKEIAENEQKSNEMKQKEKAENEPKLCMEKRKEKAGNEKKLYLDKIYIEPTTTANVNTKVILRSVKVFNSSGEEIAIARAGFLKTCNN